MILNYRLATSDEIDFTEYGKERVDLVKRIYQRSILMVLKKM